MRDETSRPYLPPFADQPSLFPPTAGEAQVWQLDLPESWHGAYLMHSSTGWHSAAAVSLSSVLEPEASIPPKYWLSAKACAGILRRAAKRGKQLPAMLEAALTSRALSHSSSADERADEA